MTSWGHEHLRENMYQRVEASPGLMKHRKQLVEHPFGTIKPWTDQAYFLMRGLTKVRAEMSRSALADNLKRVIHLLGVPTLTAAVT